MNEKEWFVEWFDTPFYHILYKNRSDVEAQLFINNLLLYLKPASKAKALDLGCGKGRHSKYLNIKGLDVLGLDLSAQNIMEAQKSANECLRFIRGDMRQPFGQHQFDYVFNLFTSFGYFDDDNENQQVIQNIADALVEGGRLVLDYMNSHKAMNSLSNHYIKTVDDIHFHINKRLDNGFIIKNIDFDVDGQPYHFQEKVKCITLADFERFFAHAGLTVEALFGNYGLDNFEKETSDRMIFVVQK